MRLFRQAPEAATYEEKQAAIAAEIKTRGVVQQAHEQLVLDTIGHTTDRLAARVLATLDLQPPKERLTFMESVLRHLVVQVFEADRPDRIGYEQLPSRADRLKYGSTTHFGTGWAGRSSADGYEIVETVINAAQPTFEQLEISED